MSEHMELSGKMNFLHLPYDEPISFTWCPNCKKSVKNIIFRIHQGLMTDWIEFICKDCDTHLWKSKIKMLATKYNKKCYICKNITSPESCFSYVNNFNKGSKSKTQYLCSKKCYNKYNKINKSHGNK